MKLLLSIILIALWSFLGGVYFPWWIIAIAAFVASALLRQQPFRAFISGFVGVFLLWGLMAYKINLENDSILARKISMLIIKSDSPMLLIALTAAIGGLVAGFAALTGSLLWKGKREYRQHIHQNMDNDLT